MYNVVLPKRRYNLKAPLNSNQTIKTKTCCLYILCFVIVPSNSRLWWHGSVMTDVSVWEDTLQVR